MSDLKRYRAGNILRGYFEGTFESIDEAWSWLSRRILISYPTDTPDGQRSIYMEVQEINPYGFKDWLYCKDGLTELNDLDQDEVLAKCKRSFHTGL